MSFSFQVGIRSKLGLKFFDGRQAAFEFIGELHEVRGLGDAHRCCRTAERVFNDNNEKTEGSRLRPRRCQAMVIV